MEAIGGAGRRLTARAERRPPLVALGRSAPARPLRQVGAAGRAQPRAVLAAHRGVRDPEQQALADHRPQVDLPADDRERVEVQRVDRPGLVSDGVALVDVDGETVGQRTEAPPALVGPGDGELAADVDVVDRRLEEQLDVDVAADARVVDLELGEWHRPVDRPPRSRHARHIDGIDDQLRRAHPVIQPPRRPHGQRTG